MLTITDTKDSFQVNTKQSSLLELQLNVSEYGHRWSHIGDELYNYSSKNTDLVDKTLTVTSDQYMYLRMLFNVGI